MHSHEWLEATTQRQKSPAKAQLSLFIQIFIIHDQQPFYAHGARVRSRTKKRTHPPERIITRYKSDTNSPINPRFQ